MYSSSGAELVAVAAQISDLVTRAADLARDGALAAVPYSDVATLTLGLLGSQDQLAAVASSAVAAADRAGAARDAGFLTTRAWISDATRWERRRVNETVRVARRLHRDHPATRDAWLAGSISAGHAAAISTGIPAAIAHLDRAERAAAVAQVEPLMIAIAAAYRPEDVTAGCARLRHAADPDGASQEQLDADATSWFRLTPVPWAPAASAASSRGGWVPSGWLDQETGTAWNTLLAGRRNTMFHTGATDSTGPALNGDGDGEDPDSSRIDHRNAVVLADIARELLDGGHAGTNGGQRPHLEISVTLADLASGIGCAELDRGIFGTVPFPLDAVRRRACDADVRRVITDHTDHTAHADPLIRRLLGQDSEVLDYGRAERIVPAGLRRRVARRDRRCIAPGCRRIPAHCQVHHVQHWLDHGDTELDNLALLCPAHHRAIHHHGWTIHATPGLRPHQHGYWTMHPPADTHARVA